LGLWVLKPSWLSESLKTGKFVSEEPHQWSSTDTTNPKEKELFDAPKRWRIRLKQENKRGAFEGWNVVLYVTKKREKGLCKVLQAGGAHIVATSPPFTRLENVTLAFVEKSLLNDVQQINCLQQQGILCYTAEYINDYLITEKPFNPSTYQVHIRDLNHKPDDNHQIKKKSSNHNIQSSSEQIRSRAKEHNGCNQMS
jgi:topoisomerase (DNA) II binding protein 1